MQYCRGIIQDRSEQTIWMTRKFQSGKERNGKKRRACGPGVSKAQPLPKARRHLPQAGRQAIQVGRHPGARSRVQLGRQSPFPNQSRPRHPLMDIPLFSPNVQAFRSTGATFSIFNQSINAIDASRVTLKLLQQYQCNWCHKRVILESPEWH